MCLLNEKLKLMVVDIIILLDNLLIVYEVTGNLSINDLLVKLKDLVH